MQQSGSTAPPGPLSPDGHYWWDGARWLPLDIAPGVAAPRAPSTVSWTAIGGGVAAIVSAVVVAIACFLPFTNFINPPAGTDATASIFNEGYSSGFWYAVEPILVVLLATVGGIVLMAWSNQTARTILSGALAAIGLQTITLFVGYAGGPNIPDSETSGPAGFVGMLGGLILLAGAITACIGALQQHRT